MSNQAYKSGYCDAIMGREAQAPYSWQHAPSYLKGYMQGKESGIVYNIPNEPPQLLNEGRKARFVTLLCLTSINTLKRGLE